MFVTEHMSAVTTTKCQYPYTVVIHLAELFSFCVFSRNCRLHAASALSSESAVLSRFSTEAEHGDAIAPEVVWPQSAFFCVSVIPYSPNGASSLVLSRAFPG